MLVLVRLILRHQLNIEQNIDIFNLYPAFLTVNFLFLIAFSCQKCLAN